MRSQGRSARTYGRWAWGILMLALGFGVPALALCATYEAPGLLAGVAVSGLGAWTAALLDFRGFWHVPLDPRGDRVCSLGRWCLLGLCPFCVGIIALHRVRQVGHWALEALGALLAVLGMHVGEAISQTAAVLLASAANVASSPA